MLSSLFIALILTHITAVCVTLYLHRSQSHRCVEFHPVVSHFMRFWLWLTTGMNTKQWVAIHRKHHQHTDSVGDPHSPHVFGLFGVMFTGFKLYNTVCKDANFVMKYGKGTPKDWIERKLYMRYPKLGILLLLAINLITLGQAGLFVWLFQMLWVPLVSVIVINALAHCIGYRNTNTNDYSHNIFPIGILISGEELHNNHHSKPANPKFSQKWWEVDIGWMYIKILQYFKLATINSK